MVLTMKGEGWLGVVLFETQVAREILFVANPIAHSAQAKYPARFC